MELEQGKNADFWRDMTIITEDEISKLRKLEASGKGPGNPVGAALLRSAGSLLRCGVVLPSTPGGLAFLASEGDGATRGQQGALLPSAMAVLAAVGGLVVPGSLREPGWEQGPPDGRP